MQVKLMEKPKRLINVGDLVEFQGKKCLVIFDERSDYPWRLVDITNLHTVTGVFNNELLGNLCTLIYTSKELVLSNVQELED